MLLASLLFLTLFLVLWLGIYLVLPACWRFATSLAAAASGAVLRQQRFALWYERGKARLRPLHPYRPLGAILALGFLSAGLTGAAFLGLAELMQAKNPGLERFDQAVHEGAHRFRTPGVTLFFIAFTLLGTVPGLALVVAVAATLLATRGRPRLAIYLVATGLGGWALNQGLKALFARARPDLSAALRWSSGYAFPSGHAMVSLVVFGALVYVVMRVVPSWRARSACVALALCLTLAISLSRIYLGVHWISDIVGGLAAGTVWLVTTGGVYEIFRRVRLLRARRTAAPPLLPSASA